MRKKDSVQEQKRHKTYTKEKTNKNASLERREKPRKSVESKNIGVKDSSTWQITGPECDSIFFFCRTRTEQSGFAGIELFPPPVTDLQSSCGI